MHGHGLRREQHRGRGARQQREHPRKNVNIFGADSRLARNATDADPATLLKNVEKLRVVERAPSAAYCKHQRRDPAACARDRTVALLAQQVAAVVPGAVGSGASLTLMDSAKADRAAARAHDARGRPRGCAACAPALSALAGRLITMLLPRLSLNGPLRLAPMLESAVSSRMKWVFRFARPSITLCSRPMAGGPRSPAMVRV